MKNLLLFSFQQSNWIQQIEEEERCISSGSKHNINHWANLVAFQTILFHVRFSEMPPQLTGPLEVSLKAEWSVPGLAVLWGVLIPLRSASRGVSVWLSSFLITPEWSEQLLLLHICVSIRQTYEVIYAERTGPRGSPVLPSASPDSSAPLSCTQLSECIWLFNFRLNQTVFSSFNHYQWCCLMLFLLQHDSRHQAKNK